MKVLLKRWINTQNQRTKVRGLRVSFKEEDEEEEKKKRFHFGHDRFVQVKGLEYRCRFSRELQREICESPT